MEAIKAIFISPTKIDDNRAVSVKKEEEAAAEGATDNQQPGERR